MRCGGSDSISIGGSVWLPATRKIRRPSGESRKACGPCSPVPANVFELGRLRRIGRRRRCRAADRGRSLEPLNVTYSESKAKSKPWADESLTSSRSTRVGSLLPIGGGVMRNRPVAA